LICGVVVEPKREQELARSVGAAIAQARLKAGITQDELAEALHIGPEAVSRLERGLVIASLPRLVELAEIFKCPVEAFLRKASDLDADYTGSILEFLAPLQKSDKELLLEIVERLAIRLSKG
jgi:transcriptional regulator with XRE-family HTH domain